MDKVAILGVLIGIFGILAGQVIEGGSVLSLIVLPAAFIVFLGTLGAVMVSATWEDINRGLELLKLAFFKSASPSAEIVAKEITEAAITARKESILALEKKLNSFSHPFMKDVFKFVVDGVDPATIRDTFENEILLSEEDYLAGAKIWTDAGGYAPTIGILGAVLGLIHVMENLSDTSKLGAGIATAFVATVYGVGSANLIFLPIGNRIKRKVRHEIMIKELILHGAIGIVSGHTPYVIQEKVGSFVDA
jgi:chemotaxis protein MotA